MKELTPSLPVLHCKGIISYTRTGTTRKGYFKGIELPLQIQDILVVLIGIIAIAIFIAYLWNKR